MTAKTVEGLRRIMSEKNLKNQDVAELCAVHVKTVESWLSDPSSANHRNMAPRHLDLLNYQLPAFMSKRRAMEAKTKKGPKK